MIAPRELQERFARIDGLLTDIDAYEEVLDLLIGGGVTPPTKTPSIPPEKERRPLQEPMGEEELASLLAKRISAERLAKGWRQQDLADATGIARPNIARLESGRRVPKISTLQRIGYALGLAIDEFLE